MTIRRFACGIEFPTEGFVQTALERYFEERGFLLRPSGSADLFCEHPESGERWLIEAKGLTSAPGPDFRTGLGQLLQGMSDPDIHYGIAVPDIPQFRAQCEKVSPRIRAVLGFRWLFVSADGNVEMSTPPTYELPP